MIGNQTPMHDGSRTPHYGNMVRDSMKPSIAFLSSSRCSDPSSRWFNDTSRTRWSISLGSHIRNNTSVRLPLLSSGTVWNVSFFFCFFSVDYDDDDGPSPFATLNPTTPSYSHLTDPLSSGHVHSSSMGISSSGISNNSSSMTSASSLLGSTGGPASVASNLSASAYSPYSNHPTPSPAMQMDYQRTSHLCRCLRLFTAVLVVFSVQYPYSYSWWTGE